MQNLFILRVNSKNKFCDMQRDADMTSQLH